MTSYGLPDWRKVGRDIGRKVRDILNPSPDPGPSKDERRTQRLQDALKGLVYFDDFDSLDAWLPSEIDPVQVSNTPLLRRAASQVHDQQHPTTKVVLCHDYKGGYHDYESARPNSIKSEMYSQEYLQYVETFVYFSHKLVSVPPASWINLLHRNGVLVLGTFLIEPQTSDNDRMLTIVDGECTVAKQLSLMAEHFGFDGWLLNIENKFSEDVKGCAGLLSDFISSLRYYLGEHKQVLWYDALTVENEKDYQNALTLKNLDFTKAASRLFTNYRWTEEKARGSQRIATNHKLPSSNIYFGIDVWAQNTAFTAHKRVTYPPKGGGGTNTGLALKVLADYSVSAAIFAPAWCFEHFSTFPQHSNQDMSASSIADCVNRSMWMGTVLPDVLRCDCHFGKPHHTHEYLLHPIVNHAHEFPAGSLHFLETNFNRAFRSQSHSRVNSGSQDHWIHPCLSFQDVLPTPMPFLPCKQNTKNTALTSLVLYSQLSDKPTRSVSIFATMTDIHQETSKCHINEINVSQWGGDCSNTRLFKLHMLGNGSLEARFKLQPTINAGCAELGIYTAYKGTTGSLEYVRNKIVPQTKVETEMIFPLKASTENAHLVELGVYMVAPSVIQSNNLVLPSVIQGNKLVLSIMEVCIKPVRDYNTLYRIEALSPVLRGHPPNSEKRLAWRWRQVEAADHNEWPKELPWSATTGPFSHFVIYLEGRELGRAYCLEFPFRLADLELAKKYPERIIVSVTGYFFGGGHINSPDVFISQKEIVIDADATERE